MTRTDVRISAARRPDAETVAEIYLRSRAEAEAAAAMPKGIHSDEETYTFVREVLLPERQVWLAVLAERPVGTLVLQGDDVHWLFVLATAQRHGVGTALLEHAKRERPDGLALWVFTSNVAARGFYEARGFRAVRETDGADNEEHSPDVRYVWGSHPEGVT